MGRRLRALIHYYGDARDLALAVALGMRRVNVEERLGVMRWARAYLGRYLRFPPSEVDRMSRHEIWAYVDLAGDLLTKEAGKIPGAETED